jgi:hypothetical protein
VYQILETKNWKNTMTGDNNSFQNFSNRIPAIYRIRVSGKLDASWSDRLAGMTITVDSQQGQKPVTTLEGLLTDQAALSGVLNTLYDLHLPVLSVEYVGSKENLQKTQD